MNAAENFLDSMKRKEYRVISIYGIMSSLIALAFSIDYLFEFTSAPGYHFLARFATWILFAFIIVNLWAMIKFVALLRMMKYGR